MATVQCTQCRGSGHTAPDSEGDRFPCEACGGTGRLSRTARAAPINQLDDSHVATLVTCIRAMEAAGLPEAVEMRTLLRELQPGYQPQHRVLNAQYRHVSNGDYMARVTKVHFHGTGRGLPNISLWLTLSKPQDPTVIYKDEILSFPAPGTNPNSGRAYVAQRWLRHILGAPLPPNVERPSSEELLGKTFGVRVDNSQTNHFARLQPVGLAT